MTKESFEQDPTSPLSDLQAKLGAYVRQVAAKEGLQATEEGRLTYLRTAQDVAWQKHCQEVLAPRQADWHTCLTNLRISPQPKPPTGIVPYFHTQEWHFGGFTEAEGQLVQLDTTVTTVSDLFRHPRHQELTEVGCYLSRPVKGRNCPKELIGVAATAGRRREIPLEPLLAAWQDALVDTVEKMSAIVVASIPGSETKQNVYSFHDLTPKDLDPNNRPHYLHPDHAAPLLSNMGALRPGEDEITKLMNFLTSQAAEPKSYEFGQLAGLATVLQISHPETRAPESA